MKPGCRLADIQNVAENEQRRKVSANSWLGMKKERKKEEEKRKKRKKEKKKKESNIGLLSMEVETRAISRKGGIPFTFHVCHFRSINFHGWNCTPAIILIENSRTSLVGLLD